ncbi:MAG TPA: hypothetical protein VLA59_07400 [Patescibacteria group bacterium]|nr:hypothetical protein [Patescibacteria group bacterium]
MRLGRIRDCGDLLMFDHVRRALGLGMPRDEGTATISVADIIGTVGRANDFDGCFRPRDPAMVKRLRAIRNARPSMLDEAIDVIRVDRGYFVMDGHKRVAIAHEEGREYIDARVQHAPTPYHVHPGIEAEAIENTAREQRFRSETELLTAVPAARFVVSRPEGYPELRESLESYGYETSQRLGRLLSRAEAAALWYECVYRPTIAAARQARLDQLIGCCTEADLFLSLHRQSRELWGTECRLAQDEADHLVTKVLASGEADQSVIRKVVARARRRRLPEVLAQRS